MNDLAPELLKGWLNATKQTYLLGYPHTSAVEPYSYTPQFIGDLIIRLFQSIFNPFLANNLLILVSVLLTFYFSSKLFTKLKYSTYTIIILSTLYSLSPYFLYRVASNSQLLYFTFVFPLILSSYLSKQTWKLGFLLAGIFYLSNYYGYIGFVGISLLSISETIITLATVRHQPYLRQTLTKAIASLLKITIPVIALVIIPNLTPFIHSSYVFNRYSKAHLEKADLEGVVPHRTLEDFFSYSFRPWYFFIPPTDSLFLGELSQDLYNQLKNTEYFLAQNYDPQEAGGVYLGYTTLFFLLFTLLIHRRRWKSLNGQRVLSFILSIFLLLSITGPPFFTIAGHKFYSPSYLFYYLMPSFRVLVRFSVWINLLVLITAGWGMSYLEATLKRMPSKLVFPLFALLATVAFGEFAIKLPIIDSNKPPDYILYLKSLPQKPIIVSYPNTNIALNFWLPLKGIPYVNPIYLKGTKFDETAFTLRLNSTEGIAEALNLEATHLITQTHYLEKDLTTATLYNSYLSKVFQNNSIVIYQIPKRF